MLNQNRHYWTPPKWLSSSAVFPSDGSLPTIWRHFLWTSGGGAAMRNEPWVWPEVGDAGTSGAGAVPLRSAQMMGKQTKQKQKTKQNKKTPLPRRMEEFRLRMTVFLATVVLPLLTVKGELSTWEQEGLQREWSAGLSRSSHRVHRKAGFPPLFVFGEPSREQARGASEGRVSPQFVSQDKTIGQWI